MTEFARDINVPVKTDYISREEAVEALRTVFDTEAWDCTDGGHLIRYEDAECALKEITAADVRPVVRCGECKYCVEHYDTDGNAPYWVCKEWDSGTDYDGYCYHGEKKGR